MNVSVPTPAWLSGQGRKPELKWHANTQATLTSLCFSRESGDLFLGAENGTLSRIDRTGKLVAIVDVPHPIFSMQWSDDGSCGAIIADDQLVLRVDRNLKVIQELKLPEVCLSVAVSPFGNHLAVGLADGKTFIYNERKRRIAQFETIRPLTFLTFCTDEAVIFGAAEHGLLCCYNLSGALIWQQPNRSNVGRMSVTGDGDLIYMAAFAHGIQAFDGDGAVLGSYQLEGTINRVDASYEPQKLIASTIERSLYWLNASGAVVWETAVPEDVVDLICDPLGGWAICGLAQSGAYCLNWRT